jgi:hypothetical protein
MPFKTLIGVRRATFCDGETQNKKKRSDLCIKEQEKEENKKDIEEENKKDIEEEEDKEVEEERKHCRHRGRGGKHFGEKSTNILRRQFLSAALPDMLFCPFWPAW